MSEGESYYLAVLTFSVLWGVLRGAMLIGSAYEQNKGSAWFWAASFAASSFGAAYCFWRLLSSGGAA